MKRLLLLFGAFFVGILLFFFLISGVGWEEVRLSLATFSIPRAFAIIFLTAAFLGVGALRWRKILESQNHAIPLISLLRAYGAGFSLMFFIPIIPFANEIFRTYVLQREHGIESKKGMASVIIDRVLEVTSNLFVVIMGGVIFLFLGDSVSYSVKSVGIIVFISIWCVLIFFLYLRFFQKKSILRVFWGRKKYMLEVEEEVFRFFRVRNAFLWEGIILSFVRSMLGLARTLAILVFFGKGIAVLPGITMLGFYYLALLVPIPGALGSHDALQAVAFSSFGLGAGSGAAFALVIRTTEMLFAIGGAVLFMRFGWSMVYTILFKKSESFMRAFQDESR